MMKPLRKRHRQIWIAWAVLLPIGIVFAWLVIPNQQQVNLITPETVTILPDIISTADKPDYRVNIRTDKEKVKWQMEWQSKSVLTVPSAVIYRVLDANPDITKEQLIGRIESRRDYVFNLPIDSAGYPPLYLILYDFIHEKKIDSIIFKNPFLQGDQEGQ